jgi:hypothetical protein
MPTEMPSLVSGRLQISAGQTGMQYFALFERYMLLVKVLSSILNPKERTELMILPSWCVLLRAEGVGEPTALEV